MTRATLGAFLCVTTAVGLGCGGRAEPTPAGVAAVEPSAAGAVKGEPADLGFPVNERVPDAPPANLTPETPPRPPGVDDPFGSPPTVGQPDSSGVDLARGFETRPKTPPPTPPQAVRPEDAATVQAMPAYQGRFGDVKRRLLTEGGGTAASEAAVAKGLAWLAREQKPGGYWEFDPRNPGDRNKDWATSTGMTLLPFFAAGHTHRSGGRYSKQLSDGLSWLKNDLNISTGKFNHGSPQYMYGHAISTMALCEAYGMTKDRGLLAHAQAAINTIVRAQAADGGWGDQPLMPGDTSIVGWQIQALRAAQLTKDISVPDATIQKAVGFLNEVSSGHLKAVYGHTRPDGRPGTAVTAIGLLCRYYVDGWGPNNPGMAEGVAGLLTNPPWNNPAPTADYLHYATRLVHHHGGPEWTTWNEGPQLGARRSGGVRDLLVTTQRPDGNVAGSWAADSGQIGTHCGRLGTTALSLLTLEVYYRELPLYKRNLVPVPPNP